MKDAQCAEKIEKQFFRFLFLIYDRFFFTISNCFDLNNRPKVANISLDPSKVAIFASKMQNVLKRMKNRFFDFLAIFSYWIWSILYSKYLEYWPKYHHEWSKVTKKYFWPSKVAIFTRKMRDVLKRMKNKFSDFYFIDLWPNG